MISIADTKDTTKDIKFHDLPEALQKLLFQLQHDKIIEILDSGIKLNDIILQNKALYDQSYNLIHNLYKGIEKDLILQVLYHLYDRKQPLLAFIDLYREYDYFQFKYTQDQIKQKEKTTIEKKDPLISTAKESFLEDEMSGSSGGSHPLSVEEGRREGEGSDSVKLCDLPIDYVPELIQKRKEDFGIWISKVALRHFESLKCKFALDDDIFRKIESYFIPGYCGYGSNKWATPIDNDKKKELGVCFGFQFTEYGSVRIHLSGDKDIEYFTTDFFEVFSKVLSDTEIVTFLEMLLLERLDKPVFYVHEARSMGPKDVVDAEFKGAHIKVNEIHWFGKIKWDARIDYSDPMKPHIEAEGPMPQAGNFMKLLDGSPEFIANLSDVREVGYRIRDTVHEVYKGVGQISKIIELTHKDHVAYLSEIDAKNHIRYLQTEIGIAGLTTILDRLYTTTTKSYGQTTAALHTVSLDMKAIALGVGTLASLQNDVKEELHEHIDHRSHLTEQLIIDTNNNVIDKIETVHKDLKQTTDDIKTLIESKFDSLGHTLKNNLYLVLRKLDSIPGATAKEISKSLNKSQKTVYSYLKKLQDKKLVSSKSIKKSSRGRPAQVYKTIKSKQA